MAPKISPPKPAQDWSELEQFSSVEEAVSAILKIAPNLACAVCSNDSFELLEDYQNRYRTGSMRYSFPEAQPETVDLSVAIACDRCGYVMSFIESTLKIGRTK